VTFDKSSAYVLLLALFQADVQPVGRESLAKTLGPLDQDRAVAERLLKADFKGFVGRLQPVEIKVSNGKVTTLIALNQGEGGARNLLIAGGQDPHQSSC